MKLLNKPYYNHSDPIGDLLNVTDLHSTLLTHIKLRRDFNKTNENPDSIFALNRTTVPLLQALNKKEYKYDIESKEARYALIDSVYVVIDSVILKKLFNKSSHIGFVIDIKGDEYIDPTYDELMMIRLAYVKCFVETDIPFDLATIEPFEVAVLRSYSAPIETKAANFEIVL